MQRMVFPLLVLSKHQVSHKCRFWSNCSVGYGQEPQPYRTTTKGYVRGGSPLRGVWGVPNNIFKTIPHSTHRGYVRGGCPLRGVWGVPKISFMKIFHRAIVIAEWQGRPQGSPLPDCIASMCTARPML